MANEIEIFRTMCVLAQRQIHYAVAGWPHPCNRDQIETPTVPMRILTAEDVTRMMTRTERRGVPKMTIKRAVEIAMGEGYNFSQTIDFLDGLEPMEPVA